MLAAAAGSVSMLSSTCSGPSPLRGEHLPHVLPTDRGHVVSQRRQTPLQVLGLVGVEAWNSTVESTCPAFIAAPRMTASWSTRSRSSPPSGRPCGGAARPRCRARRGDHRPSRGPTGRHPAEPRGPRHAPSRPAARPADRHPPVWQPGGDADRAINVARDPRRRAEAGVPPLRRRAAAPRGAAVRAAASAPGLPRPLVAAIALTAPEPRWHMLPAHGEHGRHREPDRRPSPDCRRGRTRPRDRPRAGVGAEAGLESGAEITVDLSACSFIDARGIRVLVHSARALDGDQRKLRVVGLCGQPGAHLRDDSQLPEADRDQRRLDGGHSERYSICSPLGLTPIPSVAAPDIVTCRPDDARLHPPRSRPDHPACPSPWTAGEDRLASGDGCDLRICLECGHVGCCDSSPNRHASAHAEQSNHPIIRSLEPGEEWSWCFVDELGMILDEVRGETRIPPLAVGLRERFRLPRLPAAAAGPPTSSATACPRASTPNRAFRC